MSKCEKEYPDFAVEVQKLDTEALRARIVKMQQDLEESEDHKEGNEQLRDAKQLVSELAGPYRDVKKAVRLKTKYIIEMLKERG